jgi:hypothetical protein
METRIREVADRRKHLSSLPVESLEKLLVVLESYATDVRAELARRRIVSTAADDRERNTVADRRVHILEEGRANVASGLAQLRELWKGRR